jgi:hypothetical protein
MQATPRLPTNQTPNGTKPPKKAPQKKIVQETETETKKETRKELVSEVEMEMVKMKPTEYRGLDGRTGLNYEGQKHLLAHYA